MRRLLAITGVALLGGLAYLQRVLPEKSEASINVNLPHTPYAVSGRARQMHDSLFIADLHSDSLLWKRDLRKRSDVGHMDLPRLREGNVALQVFSEDEIRLVMGENVKRFLFQYLPD